MESPDHAGYGSSSPEAGPKRSHRPRSPPPAADDKEKHTHLRFLVSNIAAGSIIGKGGSQITEFQAESGARIQLSRSNELFPGTADRIIMISGTFIEVCKAMELILDKLLNEAEEGNEADVRSKTRLVVPNSSCGAIIGKGGATIKGFIEESQAGIKISPQDQTMIGLNDRLVTVTGSVDEQLHAIEKILEKLSEDAYYPQTLNSPFPYAAIGVGAPAGFMVPSLIGYGPNGVGARSSMNKGMVSPGPSARSPVAPSGGRSSSVTIGVGDEHIGAVVGRAGRNIMEISQVSGARIKISDRGDFIPGTSERKVTITGTIEAIRTAEAMVMQKIAANSANSER